MAVYRLCATVLADKEVELAVPVEIAEPRERVDAGPKALRFTVGGKVNGNAVDRDRKRWGQVRGVAGSRRGPQPQPHAARRSRERKQNTHRNPPIPSES